MRRVIQTLGALAAAGAVVFLAVVFGGAYNVAASVGHLPGVEWVLHTTYKNSVRRRAPSPSEAPILDAAMVRLGARHYDAACEMCHSRPGQDRDATIRHMNPVPPPIHVAVGDWDVGELHWIVDHGVKMSGMPAWPADRADDVWPVVAFLDAVQAGMTEDDYLRLTDHGPEPFDYCAGCHGTDGVSGNPHIPRLDIQTEAYLALSLDAYATGVRDSGIMAEAASHVPRETLANLARRFAEAEPEDPTPAQDIDPGLAARGEAIATGAPADDDVPTCQSCHGLDGLARRPEFPVLDGQYAPYLEAQLRLWRQGIRGGGDRQNLMTRAAAELTDDDIAALAAWYASQTPKAPE